MSKQKSVIVMKKIREIPYESGYSLKKKKKKRDAQVFLNVNGVLVDPKLCTLYFQTFQIVLAHLYATSPNPQLAFSSRDAGLLFDDLISTREIKL